MLKRFSKDKGAATAVEYGLIVAVLSLAIVGGVGIATNSLEFLFSNSSSKLQRVLSD